MKKIHVKAYSVFRRSGKGNTVKHIELNIFVAEHDHSFTDYSLYLDNNLVIIEDYDKNILKLERIERPERIELDVKLAQDIAKLYLNDFEFITEKQYTDLVTIEKIKDRAFKLNNINTSINKLKIDFKRKMLEYEYDFIVLKKELNNLKGSVDPDILNSVILD